jgi:hypothetical protein
MAGLMILAIALGQNAHEPGAAIFIGVIAGVFASVPVMLGIGVYQRERHPSSKHYHLHYHGTPPAPEQPQVRVGKPYVAVNEAERSLTTHGTFH